jgi:hypothetical protein
LFSSTDVLSYSPSRAASLRAVGRRSTDDASL